MYSALFALVVDILHFKTGEEKINKIVLRRRFIQLYITKYINLKKSKFVCYAPLNQRSDISLKLIYLS